MVLAVSQEPRAFGNPSDSGAGAAVLPDWLRQPCFTSSGRGIGVSSELGRGRLHRLAGETVKICCWAQGE